MQKIKILSGSESIIVISTLEVCSGVVKNDFLHKYIPAVSISENNNDDCEFELSVFLSEKPQFVFYPKNHKAVYHFDSASTIRDIISVIDYCLDYVRQKKSIYNIHGCAVALNDSGFLMVGSVSGLGKTTLGLKLCIDYGFKFIGDEKILINGMGEILGGVKTLEFNKPDLLKSVGSWYNNKNHLELGKEIGIQYEPVPLKLIIQPMILPGARLLVEKWPIDKANWHLYEEMTRKIRGVSRCVSNNTFPLASIDEESVSIKRAAFASEISKKIKFVCLKGDVNEVMKYIVDSFTQ